ncbi:MAG: DUF5683 domain-containing protein [Ferruginibacter sp.]
MKKKYFIFLVFSFFCFQTFAQKTDSLIINKQGAVLNSGSVDIIKDTLKKYNPNIAIRRSAILPGWGQATNKKYWKIPIVYGALGTTGFLFFRNLKQYNEAKQAFILATDADPGNDFLIKEPYFSVKDSPGRIRSFRNDVRQNLDYSVLFFIIFWGLNVADAAVDAHLKTFDVSEDLSFYFKPGYSPMAKTNGISLVIPLGK